MSSMFPFYGILVEDSFFVRTDSERMVNVEDLYRD